MRVPAGALSYARAFVSHCRDHACYGSGCRIRARLYTSLVFICRRDWEMIDTIIARAGGARKPLP